MTDRRSEKQDVLRASGDTDEGPFDGSDPREGPVTGIIADHPPLPLRSAIASLGRCVFRTVVLLSRHEISQPTDRIGQVLRFTDGSGGRIYRETVVRNALVDSPAFLLVAFRLRWVRGWGHALFRAESVLNTPLFVGFPGFRSKLWLAHDKNGVYRGVYEWNEAQLADRYVRALWWVLALVSVRGSIHHVVLPDLRRDEVLLDPSIIGAIAGAEARAWWRLTRVEPPDGSRDADLMTISQHSIFRRDPSAIGSEASGSGSDRPPGCSQLNLSPPRNL
jgi:hypothetical protein